MASKIKFRSCLIAAIVLLPSALAGVGKAAADSAEQPPERPEDIWQYLEDAAAAQSAAPDRFITYAGIGGRNHRIDLFFPRSNGAAGQSSYPGLVLFHGGAWREGSPVQFYRQARVIADAGFVVALPEYALRNEDQTTPRDAVTDAFFAWSAIRSASRDLAIVPDRIFAGGASAGGQMAAALATLSPPTDITEHVQPAGLILFNPVVDNGPEGYGYSHVQDYWEAFSPLHNIGETHPDTLFLIGDSDPLIPVDTAEDYCRQVRAVDATCIVEIFPNAGHAWFNYEPAGYEGTLAAALNALKAWAQKAEE